MKTNPRKTARPTPDENGLFDIDRDIRLMSRSELVPYFASQTWRIMVRPLIKNVIWQARQRIQSGQSPPVYGNLRTFWYSHIKPVLARFGDDDRLETDPYDAMLSVFVELVLDRKLFAYADFDFTDEHFQHRRIGTTRAGVVVFAEKLGWIRFLVRLHEDFGVTVAALGGMPSALSSEYLARALHVVTSAPVRLIGIVDYDPSGAAIAEAFRDQLHAVGLDAASLTTIIDPKHYTDDELRTFRFPLPPKDRKTANWMKRTGGIDGQPFGLESESMPLEKVRNLVRELVLAAD
jgi:hypothetical protein